MRRGWERGTYEGGAGGSSGCGAEVRAEVPRPTTDGPAGGTWYARRMKPKAPKAHTDFVRLFPRLGRAWELATEAGLDGPLGEKTARLVKVGIALGSMREGAVHSAVRKALASGVKQREVEQVVALAATTLGFPATVAVHTWVRDVLRRPHKPGRR